MLKETRSKIVYLGRTITLPSASEYDEAVEALKVRNAKTVALKLSLIVCLGCKGVVPATTVNVTSNFSVLVSRLVTIPDCPLPVTPSCAACYVRSSGDSDTSARYFTDVRYTGDGTYFNLFPCLLRLEAKKNLKLVDRVLSSAYSYNRPYSADPIAHESIGKGRRRHTATSVRNYHPQPEETLAKLKKKPAKKPKKE